MRKSGLLEKKDFRSVGASSNERQMREREPAPSARPIWVLEHLVMISFSDWGDWARQNRTSRERNFSYNPGGMFEEN